MYRAANQKYRFQMTFTIMYGPAVKYWQKITKRIHPINTESTLISSNQICFLRLAKKQKNANVTMRMKATRECVCAFLFVPSILPSAERPPNSDAMGNYSNAQLLKKGSEIGAGKRQPIIKKMVPFLHYNTLFKYRRLWPLRRCRRIR